MIVEVTLKPCPWCKKTPEIRMPIYECYEGEGWRWEVECRSGECWVHPKGKHVTVRKSQKTDYMKIVGKLKDLALYWNSGNDYKAYEKKRIDLSKIPGAK